MSQDCEICSKNLNLINAVKCGQNHELWPKITKFCKPLEIFAICSEVVKDFVVFVNRVSWMEWMRLWDKRKHFGEREENGGERIYIIWCWPKRHPNHTYLPYFNTFASKHRFFYFFFFAIRAWWDVIKNLAFTFVHFCRLLYSGLQSIEKYHQRWM